MIFIKPKNYLRLYAPNFNDAGLGLHNYKLGKKDLFWHYEYSSGYSYMRTLWELEERWRGGGEDFDPQISIYH